MAFQFVGELRIGENSLNRRFNIVTIFYRAPQEGHGAVLAIEDAYFAYRDIRLFGAVRNRIFKISTNDLLFVVSDDHLIAFKRRLEPGTMFYS